MPAQAESKKPSHAERAQSVVSHEAERRAPRRDNDKEREKVWKTRLDLVEELEKLQLDASEAGEFALAAAAKSAKRLLNTDSLPYG